MNALDAAEALAKEGLSVAVANLSSIKPLDAAGIEALARKVPLIVTVEDHNVLGGAGSAVAEVVASLRGTHARVHRHGVMDTFGESGTPESLYEKHRLDAAGIAAVVREQLAG